MLAFKDPSPWEEFEHAMPSLSWKTRIVLFAICFVIGWIINFSALAMLPKIKEEPTRFAALWTLGNLIALLSTLFLWGPMKQLKSMFDRRHIFYTVIYLLAMILTIVIAYKDGRVGLVILFLFIQLIAMIMYTISSIPGGPEWIKGLAGRACDTLRCRE